ncbi:MAG: hypothetical protein KY457_00655 [Actinobacteria bacterium]|nr:hypothetical protein [Actinomycetota bacterium]
MSTELQTRLERAVGAVDPSPVDTVEVWRRGRRQRAVRRATPVVAVLLVAALGVGAMASLAGGGGEREPLDGIEDGRAPEPGWARIEPGAVVDDADLVVATDDDVELVSRLLGHPGGPFLTDVRADGAIVTVFQHPERGGIVVKHPDDEGWTSLGMPVEVLRGPGGVAINTLQWGPDDRIYVNAMTPGAAAPGLGLTVVIVLEEDGTVVGARENDDGLATGFLFADGFAWQQQTSAPDRQRWQPVVELGGRILRMPEQRAGDVERDVAPDGMVLRYDVHGDGGATFEARLGDGRVIWHRTGDDGVGVWQQTPTRLRVGATVLERPGSGPLDWLDRTVEPGGVVLHAVRLDGTIAAVHLPPELVPEHWGLVNGGDAAIGGDDRIYWVSHTPEGPALFRYRHPIP